MNSGGARHLPLLLTALRAALAPVVVLLAFTAPSRAAFAACLCVAFLSDVFDGVLARRLGVATAGLRRLDSIADTLFYIACALAAWRLAPEALTARALPIGVLVAMELARYALDWFRFGREASYHMWSSKLWGIALFAGFFCILVLRRPDSPLVDAGVYLGILADLEGLAISLVMRRWQTDVPSLLHAWRQRRHGGQG